MKKPARKKTNDELEKAAAAKLAEQTEACYAACRRLNKAVRFSFLRIIKKAHECSENEAIQMFERAVKTGDIAQDGANLAGDVKFYRAKRK